VLQAGVHRLRVSDGNPGPSIFSASSLAARSNGEIVEAATFLPIDVNRQNSTESGGR